MSKADIKNLRDRINDAKSRFGSLTTNIETQIELVLAQYFAKNKEDYKLFCHLFYPNEIELTFGKKIKIFERFFTKKYPDYLKQNKGFILALTRVRKLRNKFAHSMNPLDNELKQIIDKSYFVLKYFEDGSMKKEQFTWKDLEGRYNDIIHTSDELEKIEKVIKQKMNNTS